MENNKGYLLVGIFFIILITAVCLAIYKPLNQKNAVDSKAIDENLWIPNLPPKAVNISGIEEAESVRVDDFLKKEELSEENIQKIKDISNYSKKINASGENTADFDAVKDESSHTLYFTDSRPDFWPASIQLTVYSLNLDSQEWKEIYQSESEEFKYSLTGLKDGRLLFFKQVRDDSPGPCFNHWVEAYEYPLPRPQILLASDKYNYYTNGARVIESLDLSRVSAGFSYFVIPEAKYLHEVARQEVCRYDFARRDRKNYGIED